MFLSKFYCISIFFISAFNICSASQNSKDYIGLRTQKRDQVLQVFYQKVNLSGDPISQDKFKELLAKVALNRVGFFVLSQINAELTTSDKSLNLYVQIDQECPQFVPGVNEQQHTIKFAIAPLPLQVIAEELLIQGGDYVDTISQSTPEDVMLFHELLHLARYLHFKLRDDAIVSHSPPIRKLKCHLTVHSLFKDFPLLEAWKDNLLERIKEWVALEPSLTPQERLRRKMFLSNDFFSRPWRDRDLSVEYQVWKRINNDNRFAECTQFIETNVQAYEEKLGEVENKTKLVDKYRKKLESEINIFPLMLINPEEVRNIIGSGDTSTENLDKVCENSYRIAYNELHEKYKELYGSTFEPLKLRYGHQNESCEINEFILKWCIERALKGLEVCL